MWYSTEEEAREACKQKEKKYGYKFFPLKDTEEGIWWAQRYIEDNASHRKLMDIRQKELDRETMKLRHEKLGIEFNEEEFNDWYDNSKYAAKAVCRNIREKYEL